MFLNLVPEYSIVFWEKFIYKNYEEYIEIIITNNDSN